MRVFRGPSLEEKSVEALGRSSGFDYLRVCLATAVIVWHSFGVSYGLAWTYPVEDSLVRPVIMSILPMFFALSGYLVAGSLARTRAMSTFLGLRVVRIFPALVVELALSALILGPLLTRLPLRQYFGNTMFLTYLLNMIGDIHYNLPGVFLNNPIPKIVNGQLSTVPWELRCYIALTLLAVSGVVNRRRLFLVLVVLAMLAYFGLKLPHVLATGYAHDTVGGINLIFSFLCGVLIFRFKDVLPWSGRLAAVSVVALIALLLSPGGDYLCALPAAYLTVYLGLMNSRKIWLLRGADYSYGLYLYGFVIQQWAAQLGPWAHHWYVNLPLSMVVGSAFAALSWHLVEKPALRAKALLPPLERLLSRMQKAIGSKFAPRSETASQPAES